MNPGTPETHFVGALYVVRHARSSALFEGVATGAADGYACIAGTAVVPLTSAAWPTGPPTWTSPAGPRSHAVVIVARNADGDVRYDVPL